MYFKAWIWQDSGWQLESASLESHNLVGTGCAVLKLISKHSILRLCQNKTAECYLSESAPEQFGQRR